MPITHEEYLQHSAATIQAAQGQELAARRAAWDEAYAEGLGLDAIQQQGE